MNFTYCCQECVGRNGNGFHNFGLPKLDTRRFSNSEVMQLSKYSCHWCYSLLNASMINPTFLDDYYCAIFRHFFLEYKKCPISASDFVKKFPFRFSHCFVKVFDPEYKIVGNMLIPKFVAFMYEILMNHYYLALDSITSIQYYLKCKNHSRVVALLDQSLTFAYSAEVILIVIQDKVEKSQNKVLQNVNDFIKKCFCDSYYYVCQIVSKIKETADDVKKYFDDFSLQKSSQVLLFSQGSDSQMYTAESYMQYVSHLITKVSELYDRYDHTFVSKYKPHTKNV